MPVPPPPAPPPPPPAPSPSPVRGQARPDPPRAPGRGALLADIQKGTRLKKVGVVNDRSAPIIDKPKASQTEATVGGPVTPSAPLGGLFAAGFPVLRPTGQRDVTASRSSSSPMVRPVWSTPEKGVPFRSAPPTLMFSTNPPPPLERPIRTPPAPLGPPPPPPPPAPPSQHTKPTWLPVAPHSLPQPSAPPPPPPLPAAPPSNLPDRSSGHFPTHVREEQINSTLPPPPPPPQPRAPPISSPTLRYGAPPPPHSYPTTAPTRRPPAVPRSAAGGTRPAPPPAPPARSPSTELSSRTPPIPPPPPPSSLRNGHVHSLDDFESKFQFHSIDDFPAPEEFKPFPRIYPSKEARANPKPPGLQTHLR